MTDFLTPKPGENLPKKTVSAVAMPRLELAAQAIAATKAAIQFQGNQVVALRATNMNSMYRLMAMRDDKYWEITPEAAQIAKANPEALVAARADIAHGGNCGEHAMLAYCYLREKAKGQTIALGEKAGLDHVWVLIGDLKKDTDADMVASDGWANNPTACLWEDHFAYTADRSKVISEMTTVADGKTFKAAIGAGLKLSAAGLALVQKTETPAVTAASTAHPDHDVNNLWDVDSSAAPGKKYNYGLAPAATGAAAGTAVGAAAGTAVGAAAGVSGVVGPGGSTDSSATVH